MTRDIFSLIFRISCLFNTGFTLTMSQNVTHYPAGSVYVITSEKKAIDPVKISEQIYL